LTVSPQTVVELGKYVSESNKILAWSVAAPFIAEYYLDKVKAVLPYVDYLVANETEAQTLLKQLGIEDKDEEIAMKTLSELPKVNNNRSRVIIFTHGPDPVRIYHEGKLKVYPVPVLSKEVLVDTNGAGDAFFGGFLAGLMLDKPLDECVRAAIYAAQHILKVSGTQYITNCNFEWK